MMKKQKTNLKRHIQYDDLFGTLATLVSLSAQFLEEEKTKDDKIKKISIQNLHSVSNQLVFLQKRYRIVEK